MSVLKKIIIVLAVLIATALVAALFVKKEYAVEREITISKPKEVVFNYIKFLKNQDSYSVWSQKDPNMKKDYKGTDGTVGFTSMWDSENKNVGKGEQELVKITDGERLDFKLRFKVPFEAEDDAYMTTESTDSTNTLVKWGFKGAFPYPMNLMGLIMNMDEEVGGDLATGLANLKATLEKE